MAFHDRDIDIDIHSSCRLSVCLSASPCCVPLLRPTRTRLHARTQLASPVLSPRWDELVLQSAAAAPAASSKKGSVESRVRERERESIPACPSPTRQPRALPFLTLSAVFSANIGSLHLRITTATLPAIPSFIATDLATYLTYCSGARGVPK